MREGETANALVLLTGDGQSAASGTHYATAGQLATFDLVQDVTLNVGMALSYRLTFWLRKEEYPGLSLQATFSVSLEPEPAVITVQPIGQGSGPALTGAPLGIVGTQAAFGWTKYELQFTPSIESAATRLRFHFSYPSWSWALDGVSLQVVCTSNADCGSPAFLCTLATETCTACSATSAHW